jgi:magnesium transporter
MILGASLKVHRSRSPSRIFRGTAGRGNCYLVCEVLGCDSMPQIHSLTWHDIADPSDGRLEELAGSYSLHPLHIDDCRKDEQRAKVQEGNGYLFIILKLMVLEPDSQLTTADVGIFLGADFVITVHRAAVPAIELFQNVSRNLHGDQALYRVMESVVDSYSPLLDSLEERIEQLQDQVVNRLPPEVLDGIGEIRNTLMQLRRVLSNTRQVAFQLRHVSSQLISPELSPFFRDIHEDLAIELDMIAGDRERLAGVLDLYLSSITNRTTEATRTLTLLGTAALPTVLITSLFGMSVKYPSWTRAPWAFGLLLGLSIAVTGFLLWSLNRRDFLPGGSTSRRLEKKRATVR